MGFSERHPALRLNPVFTGRVFERCNMREACILCLALILAACATHQNNGSVSYQYQIGFEQGCSRGYVEGPPRPWPPQEDGRVYRENSLYRMGWNEGHDTCVIGNQAWSRIP
jgi:hypothetical protein